ncbi:unnamed protein product [Rotaria magnacalcarata]|uniref:Dynamin N-terminal domain-containing protein n=4 Tax=Rotaria magnacalcarata TaxID=392030 RepID=A0A816ZNB0_9BILA|nr:unnamed protein product [Rotaria magnacalcarata]
MSTSHGRLLPVTNRKAIDSSGRIASLYDAYKDLIFESINLSMKGKRCQEIKSRKCMIINGNRDQKENILKTIGVENELRLSLSLNLRDKTGLAEILDYSNPINEYTRFFYYFYLGREEQVGDNPIRISYSDKPTKPPIGTTHIITGIKTGIEIIAVLQLTSDTQRIVEIDNALQQLRTFLLNDDKILKLTQQEENLLTNSIHTKIYSNTHDLRDINRLDDVCRFLKQAQNKTINDIVYYILRPINWLYPFYTGPGVEFISLPEHLSNNIEEYVLQLRDDILKLKKCIKEDLLKLLNGYLKDRLSNLNQQWFAVNKKYTNEIDRLSKLVTGVRSGQTSISTVEQTLESDQKIQLQHMIHDLKQNINDLQQKGYFISDLDRLKFQYLNVADYGIDSVDNERTIECKLMPNYERDWVLCSNDSLNETNPSQLDHLRHGMIEELKYNPNIRLLYADFSYCSFELQYMLKLPSDKHYQPNNKSKSTPKIRSSMELSTNTSPRTKVFTDTNEPLVQPPKPQTSTTMPTEARAYQLKPSKSENSYQASTNLPTVHSLSNATQTSLLSQNKPYTSSPRPIETQRNGFKAAKIESSYPESIQPHRISQLSQTTHTSTSPGSKSHTSIPVSDKERTLNLSTKKKQNLNTSSSPDMDTINILLLGETGVGKSTFINAFVNYLTFERLDEAETSQPVVLMPVSFMITTGNDFEEHIVKFGDSDDSSNEDFSHAGQSVTQRCKSYTFQMGATYQRKLRIIDTPGFGDTRGIEQDDMNMQHILEYINNLTHLNAICILLKPNASRLNIFFRSCFTQLFSLLDPNALNNIIFCFTNARSTFYTPGDTAPLLKKMLTSLSIGNVPFSKKNVFCFDSESFRYLVARQNKIRFDNNEKEEYEMSWKTSVSESKRLVDYIRKDVTAYPIDNNLQSMKHAQFTILGMVRPILETMRNILRNLLLKKFYSSALSIELHPKVLDHPITVCLLCKGDVKKIGNFLIANDISHQIKKKCRTCSCPPNQHITLEYLLEYMFVRSAPTHNEREILAQLLRASAEFSYFLIHIARASEDDLFLSGLLQMIKQEANLVNNQNMNDMNSELVAALNELQVGYVNRMTEIKSNKELNNLSFIYKRINDISKYPIMREQLAAIKAGRMRIMMENEYKAPKRH